MSQSSKLEKIFGSISQTRPDNNNDKNDIKDLIQNKLYSSNLLSVYLNTSDETLDVLPLITNSFIICGYFYGSYQILRVPSANDIFNQLEFFNNKKIEPFDSFDITFINYSTSPVILSTTVLPDDTQTTPTIRFIGSQVVNPSEVYETEADTLAVSSGQASTQGVIIQRQDIFNFIDRGTSVGAFAPIPGATDPTFGWHRLVISSNIYNLPLFVLGNSYIRGSLVYYKDTSYILCGNSTWINTSRPYTDYPNQVPITINDSYKRGRGLENLNFRHSWNIPSGYSSLEPTEFYSQYVLNFNSVDVDDNGNLYENEGKIYVVFAPGNTFNTFIGNAPRASPTPVLGTFALPRTGPSYQLNSFMPVAGTI